MPDDVERKQRTMRTWGTASYPDVGRHFLPAVADLVDAVAVEAGERVLDVACGHGSVALTADRRGASVMGVDLTPAMLDLATANADLAGTDDVGWHVGDAEALPYADGAFDVVLSNVGHVLAPDPAAAAAELVRVTAEGGRIGFTAWRPEGPLPSAFEALADYLPPDPDAPPPPARWSDPSVVRDRLGAGVKNLSFETGSVWIPALSPADYWTYLVDNSGPLQDTLDAIDDDDREGARRDVLDAIAPSFHSPENRVEMPYRRTTATRR